MRGEWANQGLVMTGIRERRRLALLVTALILALVLVACQDSADEAQSTAIGAEAGTPAQTNTLPAATEVVVTPDSTGTEPLPEPRATEEPTITPTAESAATEEPRPDTPTPAPTEAPAEGPVAAISLSLVAGGLTRPVYLTHAFDDRLFVVEQAGAIRILANGQLEPEPFLDISDRVRSTALEQGLLRELH
jgi:glucose/arabinose dehydrogenase